MKRTTIINNEQEKQDFIKKMESAVIDKPILIETSAHKPKRSNAINKLLWVWNGQIQQHIRESQGQIYSTEDIHGYFVSLLMPSKSVEINGRERIVRAQTSQMDNKTMSGYLELLDQYCAEHLSLQLPHPIDIYNEAIGR